MTVAGRLYELATPEHLISVRDGSRLPNLPTPTAWVQDEVDMEKYLARRERVRKEANNGNGFGMTLDMTVRLLPTPTTQDAANNAGPAQENGSLPSDDGKPSDK